MEYEIYETTEGMVHVYKNYNGFLYWLDIDNRYDKTFDKTKDFNKWLEKVKAVYIGIDGD